MKAIILADNNRFEIQQVPIPVPADGQIQVQLHAAAFNPIDFQMRNGATERKRMHSRILGREGAGIITAIGAGVSGFRVGEEVWMAAGSMGSNGTFTEYVVVPQEILAHKPATLSFEAAAAMPITALTALQCYERLRPDTTDRILICGAAGGVGNPLTRLLLARGHQQLTATAGNPESHRQLQHIGLPANAIVNYNTTAVKAQLLSANDNLPFDHVVDLVGGPMSELSAAVLKINGTYVDVTALTTTTAREQLFNTGATILNISNYAYAQPGKYHYYGSQLEKIAALLYEGALQPPPIRIIGPLSAATVDTALSQLQQNKSQGHKLVMTITS
ncbi:NADP-dependent oxidoreductase [Chitinophaga pendula]|uniref:quinone oxidoreductase family protein n=1 Tax=Chitinophaga TaxID=79328 RepID=UPI000BAF61AC|nr:MULTISPECIES: NADP-dependent oxidoreductase [Chitinophaga]ASZ13121.1 alcohol dehydrogenase [Chitinophaga sp. MD30]UCJ09254.1 NADP-dependent oxidoreductase [Chitinophaga pendula]